MFGYFCKGGAGLRPYRNNRFMAFYVVFLYVFGKDGNLLGETLYFVFGVVVVY